MLSCPWKATFTEAQLPLWAYSTSQPLLIPRSGSQPLAVFKAEDSLVIWGCRYLTYFAMRHLPAFLWMKFLKFSPDWSPSQWHVFWGDHCSTFSSWVLSGLALCCTRGKHHTMTCLRPMSLAERDWWWLSGPLFAGNKCGVICQMNNCCIGAQEAT